MDEDIKQRVQAAINDGAPPDEAMARGMALQQQRTSQNPEQAVRTTTQPTFMENVGQGAFNIGKRIAKPFIETGKNIGTAAVLLPQAAATAVTSKINPELSRKIADTNILGTYDRGTEIANDPNAIKKQLLNSAEIASYAIPFGKGKNILTKATLPGMAVGGIGAANEENATLPSIVGGAALGGAIPTAINALGSLKRVTGKTLEKSGEEVMNRVFKEPIKETKAGVKAGATLGKKALQKGEIGSTEKIYAGALSQIEKLENNLDEALINSSGSVNTKEIRKLLMPQVQELIDAGSGAKAQTILNRLDQIEASAGTKIPVARANVIKRTLYNEARKAYGQQGSEDVELIKTMARGFKEGIEKNVKGVAVKQVNQDLSYYGKVADSMVDKMTRTGRNNFLGITDLILGGTVGLASLGAALPAIAAKKAITSTAGQTTIANTLNKVGQKMGGKLNLSPLVENIAGQVESRLPSILSGQPNPPQDIQSQNVQNYPENNQVLPPITSDIISQPQNQEIPQQTTLTGYTPEELYESVTKARIAGAYKAAEGLQKMYDDEVAYQTRKTKETEPVTIDRFVDKLAQYYFYEPGKSLSMGPNTVGLSGVLPRIGTESKKLTDQKYADNLKQFNDMRSIFAGMLNRARGAGTLNAGEYETVIANMPNEYTSDTAAKAWFDNVKQLLSGIDISKSQINITTE